MQKGKINVQTENIFPVIKKFLYSDHEIFLRELISNAVDASQKLKTIVQSGQSNVDLVDLTIKIKLDKDSKTLTITDRGIGMTSEEVEKYINQIAFSSAEEFLEKFKGAEGNSIIGHFGLGFYSAFMVSERVELTTKTYKKGAGTKAVKWECDGSPEYTLEEVENRDRGTQIVLHIAEDSIEFLEDARILQILNKYCRFLPVSIEFGTEKSWEDSEELDEEGKPKKLEIEKARIINNTDPIWKKAPADLSDEDYDKFYQELYPMQWEKPLFHIHLNVDYPFNLTGILYFPKVKKNFEVQKDKIQLYSNQVFITDSVEGIVPDFLTLLHGVIDSPDIPLNVSRSYLQSDSNVKKISNHISKKVADKLEELFKKDREAFEKKWDDIKVFIEYGMLSDEKFYDRAKGFSLLKNIDGKYFTFEEYAEFVKASQTDKNQNLIYLYTTDLESQYSYIEKAKEKSYDILLMDGVLDSHFVNLIESKFEKTQFFRVDADTVDKLIVKDEEQISKLSEDEKVKVKVIFEKNVNKESYQIVFESLSESDQPVLITQPEFMRRMKDMQAIGGGGAMSFMGSMPDSYNLIVNSNHRVINEILSEVDENRQNTLTKQLVDLAMLSQNLLKGKELAEFIKRSIEIIK